LFKFSMFKLFSLQLFKFSLFRFKKLFKVTVGVFVSVAKVSCVQGPISVLPPSCERHGVEGVSDVWLVCREWFRESISVLQQ
jgi:hypothetical protein